MSSADLTFWRSCEYEAFFCTLCLSLLAASSGLAFAAETADPAGLATTVQATRMTDAQIQQNSRRTATPIFRSPITTKTTST